MSRSLRGGLLILGLSCSAIAVPPPSYQEGKNFGQTSLNNAQANPNRLDPSVLPNYKGTNVPQTDIYTNQGSLSTEGQKASATSGVSRYAHKRYATRPVYIIDPKTDPTVKRYDKAANNPTAILGPLNSAFKDCKQVPVGCITKFTTQVCDEALRTEDKSCNKILVVKVRKIETCVQGTWLPVQQTSMGMAIQVFCDHTTPNHLRFRGATSIAYKGNYISIGTGSYRFAGSNDWTEFTLPTVAAVPGKQIYDASRDNQGNIARPGPAGNRWSNHKGINATGLYFKQGGCDAAKNCRYTFYHIMYRWGHGGISCPTNPWNEQAMAFGSPPKCRNGSDPTPRVRDARFVLTLNFKKPGIDYKTSEFWDNQCAGLEAKIGSTCGQTRSVCTEGPATRNINGLPVTRDCWRYKNNFRCIAGPTTDTCKALRHQGCEQLKSECMSSFSQSKICSVFKQTYRCPTQSCTGTKMVCGNQAYCMDGTCEDRRYSSNGDFGLVASALSAIDAAGNEVDVNADAIFKGKDLRCKKVITSIVNCCKLKGWGVDLGLAECNVQEQELGVARIAGRCHSVGRYCDQKVLGACVRYKSTFCCYTSKIGRIIHEQGRPQLGISWGTPKIPHCGPFTVAQFQQLDFAKIDFTEFYNDVANNTTVPNAGATSDRIKNSINRYYQGGGSTQ